MSLKRKSPHRDNESPSSKKNDYEFKKLKFEDGSNNDAKASKRFQLDHYPAFKKISSASKENSVDRFLDSLKRDQKTLHSLKREQLNDSHGEIDRAKKNLSAELQKEQLPQKSKRVKQNASKKLKQARADAKLSKKGAMASESGNNSFISLEEFPADENRDGNVTNGQLVQCVPALSLNSIASSYWKCVQEASAFGQTGSSHRNIAENKWLKRLMEGSPFKLPQSSHDCIDETHNFSESANVQGKVDNQSMGSNESDFQPKTTNFLDEVFANEANNTDNYQSPQKSPGLCEEKIDCCSAEKQASKSNKSLKSISNTKTNESLSIERTRGTELVESTPRTKKLSAEFTISGLQSTLQKKTKSPKLNDEQCIRELEVCKSKLKRTLLEKETIEQKLKCELDEKDMENALLRSQLSKLKSELRKSEHYRKKLHDNFQEIRGNLRIYCRVKPLFGEAQKTVIFYPEKELKDGDLLEDGLKTIDLKIKDKSSTFFFDHVFDESCSQADIFETIKPFFQSALDGDQVCILAYGQTGSGKTFTLEGPDLMNSSELHELSGVLPRAANFIFNEVERISLINSVSIYISALEIYNENIYDLLAADKYATADKITINFVKNRVQIQGLEWVKIQTHEQMLSLLSKASRNRSTDKTGWNDRSSRSHSIFRVKIVSGEQEGLLNIVDLAGSERNESHIASNQNQPSLATQNAKKIQTEANFINKSLTTLGRIVRMIAEKKPTNALPYRESKLTRLLQDSLGGTAKTLLFINVCPSEENSFQTKESLKFSSKISL